MLTFQQINAVSFRVCLSIEDTGRYKTRPGEVTDWPIGTLYKTGSRWSWDCAWPALNASRIRQLAHKCFALQLGRCEIAKVPDGNKLSNFRDSWQQMPSLEKGHETIKAAAVNADEVRATLQTIAGTPAGWKWNEETNDYEKEGESIVADKPKPEMTDKEFAAHIKSLVKTFIFLMYGPFGKFVVPGFGRDVHEARRNLAKELGKGDNLNFTPSCVAQYDTLAEYHADQDNERFKPENL